MDVAFIGKTAYALVTLVGPDVGGSDIVGIYRVDGPDSFTVVADIGAFALSNPPSTPFDVPTGLQYALETYRGGFLVTDGHHNRVLRVTLDGEVTELIAFDNIVPTGLEVKGNTAYMAEAGPVPHEPEDGKVVSFRPKSPTATDVASGASLLVDVEFGRGRKLYALSQGVFGGGPPGAPAQPNTGSLVKVNRNGTSLSSRTAWTGPPRSSSSGTPRTSSPSPGRSGRSDACRVERANGARRHPGRGEHGKRRQRPPSGVALSTDDDASPPTRERQPRTDHLPTELLRQTERPPTWIAKVSTASFWSASR
jgi:hypothetical protein